MMSQDDINAADAAYAAHKGMTVPELRAWYAEQVRRGPAPPSGPLEFGFDLAQRDRLCIHYPMSGHPRPGVST